MSRSGHRCYQCTEDLVEFEDVCFVRVAVRQINTTDHPKLDDVYVVFALLPNPGFFLDNGGPDGHFCGCEDCGGGAQRGRELLQDFVKIFVTMSRVG